MARMRTARCEILDPGAVVGDYVISKCLYKCLKNSCIYTATCESRPGKFVFKYIAPAVSAARRDREIAILSEIGEIPFVAPGFDPIPCPKSRTSGYFMKFYDIGSLHDHILNVGCCEENEVCAVAYRMLIALSCLHARGIVHCDVKPENILLSTTGDIPDSFLTDFGAATHLSRGEKSVEFAGTETYQAPEMIEEKPFDCSVDIWSLGATLFEMAAGVRPFTQDNLIDMKMEVVRGEWHKEYISDRTPEFVELIGRMLTREGRITAEEALKHPFFGLKAGIRTIAVALDTAFTDFAVSQFNDGEGDVDDNTPT
jgi:serine/threonine protein kinase